MSASEIAAAAAAVVVLLAIVHALVTMAGWASEQADVEMARAQALEQTQSEIDAFVFGQQEPTQAPSRIHPSLREFGYSQTRRSLQHSARVHYVMRQGGNDAA